MTSDLLQEWAEDSRYQFKALHKTADIYHYLHRISTLVLLVAAVATCGWEIAGPWGKVLSVTSLCVTVALLVYQKDIEKVDGYRRHADKYKGLFDLISLSINNRAIDAETIRQEIESLRSRNAYFPISQLAILWTRRVIDKEMSPRSTDQKTSQPET